MSCSTCTVFILTGFGVLLFMAEYYMGCWVRKRPLGNIIEMPHLFNRLYCFKKQYTLHTPSSIYGHSHFGVLHWLLGNYSVYEVSYPTCIPVSLQESPILNVHREVIAVGKGAHTCTLLNCISVND